MKKSVLPIVCPLAFLLFTAYTFSQENPTPASGKVVILQKLMNDDGTVTVKKKRFDKGQNAEAYIEAMELKEVEKNIEIMVITGDEDKSNVEDPETILFIRKAKSPAEEQGCHKMMKNFETLRITVPGDFQGMPSLSMDKAALTLVGDEKKAFLGVYTESGDLGVLLEEVVEGSSAQAAGLVKGDILTAVNGASVKTSEDLRHELAKYQPGDDVVIAYLRNGQAGVTDAVLSEKKSERRHTFTYTYTNSHSTPAEERDPCKVFIGVYVGSYGNREEGVGVSGIIPGWPAEAAGLKAGDRIIAIDGIPVNSYTDLTTERNKHKPGEYFTITYLRDGMPEEVRARFKECPALQPTTENKAEPQQEQALEVPQQAIESKDNTLELDELSAYPNPTFGDLNVQFKGEPVSTTVRITDIQGKVLHQETLNRFDGYYNKNLDISHGTPGTVMLTIQQGEKVLTKPLILLNRA